MTVPKDVSLKLGRARKHAKTLNRKIKAFVQDDRYRFVRQLHNGGQIHTYRCADEPVADPRWAAILGDALFNYRSALDHLANLLVPKPDGWTEFPIFWNESKFNREVGKKLPGIAKDRLDAIRELQPYKRGNKNSAVRHQLWRLHELHIIDKHRRLVLAAVAFQADEWGLSMETPQPKVETLWHNGTIEPEGPELRFTFPTPQPYVDLHAQMSLHVVLQETGYDAWAEPVGVLGIVDSFITKRVLDRLEQFL